MALEDIGRNTQGFLHKHPRSSFPQLAPPSGPGVFRKWARERYQVAVDFACGYGIETVRDPNEGQSADDLVNSLVKLILEGISPVEVAPEAPAEYWELVQENTHRRIGMKPRALGLGWLLAVLAAVAACGGEVQSLAVNATAYNSVPGQTQGDPTIGAWGDKLRPGDRVIAVSPDLIELGLDRGTLVKIEGLPGRYRVLDKTHSRLRRTIDIYMGTDIERARAWGVREVRLSWRSP